mmetsp:Transcript_898/g.3551  ORF Transcript_898/g.3551 Transcript_898/m.3551 type:complete len:255 (-) Transcript_898:5-769(-)
MIIRHHSSTLSSCVVTRRTPPRLGARRRTIRARRRPRRSPRKTASARASLAAFCLRSRPARRFPSRPRRAPRTPAARTRTPAEGAAAGYRTTRPGTASGGNLSRASTRTERCIFSASRLDPRARPRCTCVALPANHRTARRSGSTAGLAADTPARAPRGTRRASWRRRASGPAPSARRRPPRRAPAPCWRSSWRILRRPALCRAAAPAPRGGFLPRKASRPRGTRRRWCPRGRPRPRFCSRPAGRTPPQTTRRY